jgi:hypothetical protein
MRHKYNTGLKNDRINMHQPVTKQLATQHQQQQQMCLTRRTEKMRRETTPANSTTPRTNMRL